MKDKLLLQDLVVLLAKKANITQKDADQFFRELTRLILNRVYENDIVKIKNFGTFKPILINSRESIDVNTGEKIEIPAHLRLSFVPDNSLKDLLNKPFAQFESVLLDDEYEDELNVLEFEDEIDTASLLTGEISPLTVVRSNDITSHTNDRILNNTRSSNALLSDDSLAKKELKTEDESKAVANQTSTVIESFDKKEQNDTSESINLDKQAKMDSREVDDEILVTDAIEEDDDLEEDDLNHQQPNYEQQDLRSKRHKKIAIIIVSIAIGAFAIYQYAKLFNVTYDYEYYINQVPDLTLTDTLPYLDENVTKKTKAAIATSAGNASSDSLPLSDKIQGEISTKDSAQNALVNKEGLLTDLAVDGVLEEEPSDLDSLLNLLDPVDKLPNKEFVISDGVRIKVTNKANSFLRKR